MSDITSIELKDIDPEDISDVLLKVEESFGFKFGKTELKDVKYFGELCDIITQKVQGDNSNDCTTQQAFYKVRSSIADTVRVDTNSITPDTDLEKLFPRYNRRHQILATEKLLGFKIRVLRPKHWIMIALVLITFSSLVSLAFYWQLGLAGVLFSIIGFKLVDKFGNELDLQTVGQLAEKIARENYLKSRRNPATVNRNEIVKKIEDLFRTDLDLEDSELNRQSAFV